MCVYGGGGGGASTGAGGYGVGVGLFSGLLGAYSMQQEAEVQTKIARDAFNLETKQIAQKKEQEKRAYARNDEQLQIRLEQEKVIAAQQKSAILKKQLQEEATATVVNEYRGVEGASVDNFQNQLARENLNIMSKIAGDFNSVKTHIKMMSADNLDNYNATEKALGYALDEAKLRKDMKTPDMGLVSLGQFGALLNGYMIDKKLEGGTDTWGLGTASEKTGSWWKSLFAGPDNSKYLPTFS